MPRSLTLLQSPPTGGLAHAIDIADAVDRSESANAPVPFIGDPAPLSPSAQHALAGCTSTRRRVAPWTELLAQGEEPRKFFIVSRGWICQYKLLANGQRLNLKFALPGDLVGYLPDGQEQVDYSAVSLTGAEVWVIDVAAARRVLKNNLEIMVRLVAYLMREDAMARERLTSVARTTALERVAHLLYELFHRMHHRAPSVGDRAVLPLTQEQIGDAVGLSAVHVNRMIAQLRREGTLILSGGRLHILRARRFAELAGMEPGSPYSAVG